MEDWRDALKGLVPDDGVRDDREPLQSDADAVGQAAQKGPVHISLERKGRGGKTATIIYDFTIADADLRDLAAEMKRALGCGGSARGGEILVQGERVADCRRFLEARGYKVKWAFMMILNNKDSEKFLFLTYKHYFCSSKGVQSAQ